MSKKYLAGKMVVLAVSAALLAGYGTAAAVCAENTTAAYANTVSPEISEDDAGKAAIAEAGLKENDVVIKNTGLDYDDFGILKYDVEFYADGKKFEYDIDAVTGDVIRVEHEKMNKEDYARKKALQNQNDTQFGDFAEDVQKKHTR